MEGSPSYIQDTTNFIQKLSEVQQLLPEDTILFPFDVAKLYLSVPRKEGIQACKEDIEIRKKPLVPAEYVVEMIQTVLDNCSNI